MRLNVFYSLPDLGAVARSDVKNRQGSQRPPESQRYRQLAKRDRAARATAPSRLSLADAQQRYDEIVDRYPV
jgi:hypothetical protein